MCILAYNSLPPAAREDAREVPAKEVETFHIAHRLGKERILACFESAPAQHGRAILGGVCLHDASFRCAACEGLSPLVFRAVETRYDARTVEPPCRLHDPAVLILVRSQVARRVKELSLRNMSLDEGTLVVTEEGACGLRAQYGEEFISSSFTIK